MTCKYFLPFCGLPFLLCDSVFWCTIFLHFHEVQLGYFFFCYCTFGSYPRNHCQIQCHEVFTYGMLDIIFLIGWGFFLLAFWIYHPIPFWFARFPLRNSIIILQEILLFFHCFLRFSLAVIFDSLSIFLSVGLFGFILMGVFWSFWICMLISFLKFGSLGLLFLQIGFQTIYFSLLFLKLP